MRALENPFENPALLLLRIGTGAMMLTHGIPKLQRLVGNGPIEFMDFLGLGPVVGLSLAVFAEVVCATLVIIGFKTRLAVIPLIITMCTAAFVAHGADPFGRKELPLLYAIAFLVILVLGPGKFSIDSFRSNKANVYGG